MILNHRILGQGPPLIILHGLFGSLDNWMSIAKQLSQAHTVYLVDLRNHGASFHDSLFNYQVMSEDIKRFTEDLDISGYTLLGHSLGGKVAMFSAVKNLEGILKLIVVDIGPKFYPIHHQLILDGLSSIDVKSLISRSQADNQLREFIPESGIRQFLLKNLKRSSEGGFEWKMNLPVIRQQIENVGEALPLNSLVQVPTMFIRGGSSNYIAEDDYFRINQQFPASTITSIPGAGHWVHAEAPAEFLKVVTSFLDKD